jgi:hypothetical protein
MNRNLSDKRLGSFNKISTKMKLDIINSVQVLNI